MTIAIIMISICLIFVTISIFSALRISSKISQEEEEKEQD